MTHPAYPTAATLRRERRINQRATEIAAINEHVARILIRARDEMLKLPDVESMIVGYDFGDVVNMLGDMMPDLSNVGRARLLAVVGENDEPETED